MRRGSRLQARINMSADHLPHLPSSPAACLVPVLGQCLRPTTPGASSPTLLPATSLSQSSPSVGSCRKGRGGGSGWGADMQCGQAVVTSRTQVEQSWDMQ